METMYLQNSNALYGGYTLKKGDNDKKKTWSGKKHSNPGNHVELLQKDLNIIGVYLFKVDGDFGNLTEAAVKRFQWNAKNLNARLKHNFITQASKTFTDNIDGVVGKNSKKELAIWLSNSYIATGDLIRIKENRFSNIELSDSFRKVNHPSINNDEMIVSSAILDYLKSANKKAKELSLNIKINQTMRLNGAQISGAVVTPARKSQHLIGHAIDCNIVDGDNWNTSAAFRNNKETESAKEFISAMKANGLRWGGDFSRADTPHFDKQVIANGADYDYKYFFNQRMVSEKQHISLKTW